MCIHVPSSSNHKQTESKPVLCLCQDKQEVLFIPPFPSSTGSPFRTFPATHMQPLGERRLPSTSRYGGACDFLPFPHVTALANHQIKDEHCAWWTRHTSALPLCNQVLVQSVIVVLQASKGRKKKRLTRKIQNALHKIHITETSPLQITG